MVKENTSKTLLELQVLNKGETVTAPLYVSQSDGVSFQVVWVGTPVTTIRLQTSNDPRVETDFGNATWYTENVTISGCNGAVANGSVLAHFNNFNCSFARLKFSTTVSGSVAVYAASKT